MSKKLFIDLGAYNGDSIDIFYSQVEDASEYDIIAFEPNPNVIKILKKHVTQRGYKNVIVVEAATGTHFGTTELFTALAYDGRGSTLLHGKITGRVDYDNPVIVKCINFCDWLTKRTDHYNHIILKANIEGSEYLILKEMLKRKMIGMIDRYCVCFHQNRFGENKGIVSTVIEESFIKEVKRLRIPLCINHYDFCADNRPEILWVCDTPGWAYDKIATEFSVRLPQFRHTKLYISTSKGFRGAVGMGRAADLIVCFYPPYMQLFTNLNKMIIRLDGNRAFERTDDIISGEHQELELECGISWTGEYASSQL